MSSPSTRSAPPRWRPGRPNIPPRAAPLPGCAARRTSVGPTTGQSGGRMRLVDIITQASTRANGRKARGAGPPFGCWRLVLAPGGCRPVGWPWVPVPVCCGAGCGATSEARRRLIEGGAGAGVADWSWSENWSITAKMIISAHFDCLLCIYRNKTQIPCVIACCFGS